MINRAFSNSFLPDQPSLDPQTAAFLKELNKVQERPIEQIDVKELRQIPLPSYKSLIQVGKIQDLSIPGPNGAIPIRLYSPKGAGPFPVFVSFEGGGWIAGSLESNDNICREICHRSGCMVVSVEYRKAPEDPFPKPLEDCYAATSWAAKNIQKLNGDPRRIAVGGDSAGGNLAAAVTLLARERKGPPLRCQILIYPVTNFNFETLSYYENAEGYFLTRSAMKYFWSLYLNGADGKDPRASPLQAPLSNLPPALVIVAQYDPLRDEGLAYAYQLKKAGVPVVLQSYPTIHGFVSAANTLTLGQKAIEEIAAYLRKQLKLESDSFTN